LAGWHAFRRGLATNLTSRIRASRFNGFPRGLRKLIPLWNFPNDPVPVEKEFQLRDHRDGSFALLPFRFAGAVPPYGLLHFDGVAVVAVPNESTDFTLAGTRECCDRDGRGPGFRENCEPPNLFLKRVRVRLPRTWRARNSIALCPVFSRAASAPGVATSWPGSDSGFDSVCCMGKYSFVDLGFAPQAPQSGA